MNNFFDTSVLVAAFWRGHPSHVTSLELLAKANRKNASCALHTLAELYATMTALPVKELIPPDQALLFVQEVRDRCAIITLDEHEYYRTMTRAAELNLSSGRVYDALLIECAFKAKAKVIYTLNLRHFRAIRPDLAERMRTP